jgi:hypothetical protein
MGKWCIGNDGGWEAGRLGSREAGKWEVGMRKWEKKEVGKVSGSRNSEVGSWNSEVGKNERVHS